MCELPLLGMSSVLVPVQEILFPKLLELLQARLPTCLNLPWCLAAAKGGDSLFVLQKVLHLVELELISEEIS